MQVTKAKIVMLGDQSVGKTSIINRIIFNQFTGTEQPTIGIDYVSKTASIGNKTLRMQFWDTAGQQRFRSLIPGYIKDTSAAIIVFDITSRSSFESLDRWVTDVREERGDEAVMFALGNKVDVEEDRKVTTAQAEAKFSKEGIKYFQVSAKLGTNMAQFFSTVTNKLMGVKSGSTSQVPPPPPKAGGVSLEAPTPKKRDTGGCKC